MAFPRPRLDRDRHEDPGSRPVPDPTTLTTDQLEREIKHLRELIEARLTQVESQFREQAIALKAALEASNKAIVELDTSITRRIDGLDKLTDSKFITHRTLLDSQADKVALALTAADKAVTKAEQFNEKRFESLSEKIDYLRQASATGGGRSAGLNAGWTYLVAAVGLIVVLVNVAIYLIQQ